MHIGGSKSEAFAYLKDQIYMEEYKVGRRNFCRGPEEGVDKKAVAQAIPIFAMGCFDLTRDLCDQISTSMPLLVESAGRCT